MASLFPSITYDDICQLISEKIVLFDNIGTNYNNKIPISMKKDYNYYINVSSITDNASLWWQARYSMDNLYAIRIPSNKSFATILSIKDELVSFLNSYNIDTSTNITPGSFLPLIQVLIWFLSCKVVCHTSQQQFTQTAKGTDTSIGTDILLCYDDLISTVSYIKERTGWDEKSRIKKIERSNSKIIESIDFERIINALVYAFKASYKFSGTYYNFNLLGGKPGGVLTFEITAYNNIEETPQLIGIDKTDFDKNLKYITSIEYIGGDPVHDIEVIAPNTTTNYYFNYWKTPSEKNEEGKEKEITTLDLKIGADKLFDADGNPIDSFWFGNAFYTEKDDNTLNVVLTSKGKFTSDPDKYTVTANKIGETSIEYSGCEVTIGNNKNKVVYSGKGDLGFRVDEETGIVTCDNKGTYVVFINQETTDKIKKYLSSYTVEVVEEKLKLTTDMFTFVAPSTPTYGDASKNTATFKLKSGYTGVSPFRTVQYAKLISPMSWTNNAPSIDGTYVCRLIVDSGSIYEATGSDGLYDYDNWKFTVPEKTTTETT